MELILTHEQVDFDALGGLIAARILFDSHLPVLPRRQNQNVRKFLNLYKQELKLVDTEELPGEPIESIVLVDTQSLVTLRNFKRDTPVLIIDHHVSKPDVPETWKKKIEKLGATTTILVHLIKEKGIRISPLEATVMLLGIHEDTGSLTYASTSTKDIYAAAYLVENGANLQFLNDYLNPPLSEAQMVLTDELIKNSHIFSINGKKILLSSATDLSLDEEISSIAHKLRDLMDPDALFLLVRNKEGLRLVARSTTDDVDVSQVASLFGGGGHPRAAAALINADDEKLKSEDPLKDASELILQCLHGSIKPSLTVARIMSKKPLLITKDTSIKEAVNLMSRYGYEGYPVVEGSAVVGLLTRRAVDKASSHKLELTAGSLMEAGSVTLTPDQTLDEVQELMANTGWGQIPVVDTERKSVIGIVTRTDLLKNLQKLSPKKVSDDRYSDTLEQAIPPALLAVLQQVIMVANKKHLPIYLVGGVVRDMLLGRSCRDLDIVVEGDAIGVANALVQKFGGRIISHHRFGTAKWQIKDIRLNLAHELAISLSDAEELPEFLDLISARTEFYEHPSAMPTVENSSIKLDLHRRDFTINTLALRLDGSHYGELIDHFGGLADLQQKKIRVLHSLSFVDDPTRMLRAVRFEQRFAFKIEERTLQLMNEARTMLRQVSGDRLRHEFDLTFKEPSPQAVLKRLVELDLLSLIHPALQWEATQAGPLTKVLFEKPEEMWNLPKAVGNVPTRHALGWIVWIGSLPPNSVSGVSQRLKFPAPLASCIRETARVLPLLRGLIGRKPSEFCTLLDSVPPVSLYAAYVLIQDKSIQKLISDYQQKWKNIQPVTTGDDLRNAGILPGPRYKQILNTLRAAYLDGTISTVDEEKQLLAYLIQQD